MDPDYKYESEKYKLILANDLIIYLCLVLTHYLDKSQASQLLGKTMQSWTERVEEQFGIIKQEQVQKIAEYALEGDTEDVLDIIVQAHQALPTMLREEFVGETLEAIQKMVIEKK
jgi:hypothetical protein